MRRIQRKVALLALSASAGCYNYAPVEVSAVPPDAYVRIYLTRRGIGSVPEGIPMGASFVTGRFVRQTTDSILLRVPVQHAVEGNGAQDLAQNVYVPIGEVLSVDRRKLSAPKTLLSIAGGALVIGGVAVGVAGSTGGNDPGQQGTGG